MRCVTYSSATLVDDLTRLVAWAYLAVEYRELADSYRATQDLHSREVRRALLSYERGASDMGRHFAAMKNMPFETAKQRSAVLAEARVTLRKNEGCLSKWLSGREALLKKS